jgi:hypothetical protein
MRYVAFQAIKTTDINTLMASLDQNSLIIQELREARQLVKQSVAEQKLDFDGAADALLDFALRLEGKLEGGVDTTERESLNQAITIALLDSGVYRNMANEHVAGGPSPN